MSDENEHPLTIDSLADLLHGMSAMMGYYLHGYEEAINGVLDEAALDTWENEGGTQAGTITVHASIDTHRLFKLEHGNGRFHVVETNVHPTLLNLLFRAARGEDVGDEARAILDAAGLR